MHQHHPRTVHGRRPESQLGPPRHPMGIAPVAYTLWQRYLRFDPADPIWPNRDRFVLSEGHASTLLWSLLHLAQVQAVDSDYEVTGRPAVTMDDLKTFRQLGSHCPGHPEYRLTSGVEATTGPLGQGVANSVGMAIASDWLATRYNQGDFTLFDFNVYALAGDGCMMEGISSRGGVARRSSRPVQPLLDLRLQSGHDRRAHRHRLHRGRGRPVPRLQLERHHRGRRQRSRLGRPEPARLPLRTRAAHADPGPQPHRLRLAARGLAQGSRRTAGRRRRPLHQTVPRHARRPGLLRSRRRVRAFRRRASGPEAPIPAAMGGLVGEVPGQLPGAGRRARSPPAPPAS